MMGGDPDFIEVEIGVSGDGPERWEMFPDPGEQQALRSMEPEDLAVALWERSGEFVFSVALPEIARNISVEKAVGVARAVISRYPSQVDQIRISLESVQSSLRQWSVETDLTREYGYDPEHINRHRGLIDKLEELIQTL